jgi:hypothetical protein
MKTIKAIIILACAGQFFLTGCGGDTPKEEKSMETTPSTAATPATEKVELIIDAKTIVNKTLAEVETVLGKAESKEKVKGFPCENSNCEKALFKSEKYEIIFKEGKADRITINAVANLTGTNKAIEALGFPYSEPAFMNAKTVVRWNNTEGIKEISFFPDYILIQVSETE